MNSTSIEWCNRPETRGPAGAKTWNPVRARIRGVRQLRASAGTFCTRISPGCTHCYASTINKRFGNGLEFTVPNLEKIEFFIDDRILAEPLEQKKPCTIFAGDMNDIFHEAIATWLIDKCIAVAALSPQHTLQFLTKRADRLQAYFSDRDTPYRVQQQVDCIIVDQEMAGVAEVYAAIPGYEGNYEVSNYGNIRSKTGRPISPIDDHHGYLKVSLYKEAVVRHGELLKSIEADTGVDRRKISQIAHGKTYKLAELEWPLPNIWLGVSVEDQQRANERIPFLLQTPAAVRFLSVEPMLEAVNLVSIDGGGGYYFNCLAKRVPFGHYEYKTGIDWVICGGESGPGARPFNLEWAVSLLKQCRAAGVPFFMKQTGANLFCQDCADQNTHFCGKYKPADRKGGNPSEWPEALRVREFPAVAMVQP